jgi:hypothetical protein
VSDKPAYVPRTAASLPTLHHYVGGTSSLATVTAMAQPLREVAGFRPEFLSRRCFLRAVSRGRLGGGVTPRRAKKPTTPSCTLSHHEAEDLHAYLVASAWEISLRFEPGRGVYFSRYAAPRLRNKSVDCIRKERGRTRWVFSGGRVHERKRPEFVPLDAELVDTVLAGTGDPEDGDDPDCARLVADRDSRRARDLKCLGLERLNELRNELERLSA